MECGLVSSLITEVQFRVYKEFHIHRNGTISGEKKSAETPLSGFTYIFREIAPGESNNADGTRTRLLSKLDMSKTQRTTLLESSELGKHSYFFVYSPIQLTENRLESI